MLIYSACADASQQQFSQVSLLPAGAKSGLTHGYSIQTRSKTAAASVNASHSTTAQMRKRIKTEDTASSSPAVSRKKSNRRKHHKAASMTKPQRLVTEAATTSLMAAPKTKKGRRSVIETDKPSCKRKRATDIEADSDMEPAMKKKATSKSNTSSTQLQMSTVLPYSPVRESVRESRLLKLAI